MPYKHREDRNRYARQWLRERRQKWLRENGPCVQCGSSEKLEVDHIDPKQKTTHRVWSYSAEKREEELAKCQVLCSKCHLEKSLRERDYAGLTHGTNSGYTHYKCRCDACRREHVRVNNEWRYTKGLRIRKVSELVREQS